MYQRELSELKSRCKKSLVRLYAGQEWSEIAKELDSCSTMGNTLVLFYHYKSAVKEVLS